MSSQLDEHGQRKRWKGRQQPKVYLSKAKQEEMEASKRLASGGRPNPCETLARPFRPLTFKSKETQTEPVEFKDQKVANAGSKPRTPRSELDLEDEENRPSQIKLKSYSSDTEDEDRAAFNDIAPSNFLSKKSDQLKNKGKDADKTSRKSFKRIEFSASGSEPENKPRSSQISSKRAKDVKIEKKAFVKSPAIIEDEPVRIFKTYNFSPSPEPEDKAPASRPFIKLEATASPERKSATKRFVAYKVEEGVEEGAEAREKERKRAFTRAAILREAGGSPNQIKRTLIDAGLGEGLDDVENKDIWRSPPKKVVLANQGLSGLAARIASRRVKEEQQEIKDEEVDDGDVFLDSDQACCPMCHESVPSSLLMAFSNNRPRSLNTRQQAAFCVHHKRDSALTSYSGLGYPDVHWDTFQVKLANHFDYISSLITSPATTPSHYRPLFASDIKHGRNRTLKQSIMGTKGEGSSTGRILTPGYYGPRGAQAIQQAIMLKFNRELRRAAVEDHVVSARAVGGYVASVLVPELGTRLIMEDMKIGEEAARKVMEDSAALGSLVNEELKDVRGDAERSTVEEADDYD